MKKIFTFALALSAVYAVAQSSKYLTFSPPTPHVCIQVDSNYGITSSTTTTQANCVTGGTGSTGGSGGTGSTGPTGPTGPVISGAPQIFVTSTGVPDVDITSGPPNTSGWAYGVNLAGGIPVPGAPPGTTPWMKVQFIIPANQPNGPMTITNTNSFGSASFTFTVRPGNLYYVATNGSDSNPGTLASPWKTVLHARDTMKGGDIVYLRQGVSQSADDGQGWHSSMLLRNQDGTAAKPLVFAAYPNETASIGASNGPTYGIRAQAYGLNAYITFSGLTLRGNVAALEGLGNGWKIIGNDISCPSGTGQDACLESTLSANLSVWSNNVHDVGNSNSSKQYHGVYFSTNSNSVDFGWNRVQNILGCRGVQFHSSKVSTGGQNQFDLHVHDNTINNVRCDGINFATVDPSKGVVEAYNNLIYHVGIGPDPVDGAANYACIYNPDYTNAGSPGSGFIQVRNNTMYDCGSHGAFSTDHGAIVNRASDANTGGPGITAAGNITQLLAGEVYLNGSLLSAVNGTGNLWYGVGNGPSQTSGNINANPLFVNPAAGNFQLQSGSPGSQIGAPWLRPQ